MTNPGYSLGDKVFVLSKSEEKWYDDAELTRIHDLLQLSVHLEKKLRRSPEVTWGRRGRPRGLLDGVNIGGGDIVGMPGHAFDHQTRPEGRPSRLLDPKAKVFSIFQSLTSIFQINSALGGLRDNGPWVSPTAIVLAPCESMSSSEYREVPEGRGSYKRP